MAGNTNRSRGGRGAGGLRGLDAVPPTPPSNTSHTPAEPDPAPSAEVVPLDQSPDDSKHASIDASKQATGDTANERQRQPVRRQPDPVPPIRTWGVADLVGEIDPEKDLFQSGIRLPKYVMEAMRLYSTLTRRSQQAVATEGAKSVLPPELLDDTYRRLYGRERPDDQ